MEGIIKGKAHVFGPNIDTDQIYPGRYLELTEPVDIAAHVMEGADPNFVKTMAPGDIVVAQRNFGCGSSREHAAITLKYARVGAVVAESFARIFFRNAINLGVPLMVCPGIADKVSPGDELEVDLARGEVRNLTKGEVYQGERLADHILEILKQGGIKSVFRKRLELE
ncbi:MAG: 3-isopropylmalate dehydratase small subunit [bacterium]|jgi:3-isopropylmalate/(R)-2-methylmalate dehydratase small subunit